MNIIEKSFPVFITKVDRTLGIVDAIVSVFGNIDFGDDIIHAGAFIKTITERLGKIKVLDNHNYSSVRDVIGKPLEIRELNKSELPLELLVKYPNAVGGLFTRTQYAIDTNEGLGIFKRIADNFINEYSIGFTIPKGKWDISEVVMLDGTRKKVRNIREIKLHEYSPVVFAMNDATMTLDAKNNQTKDMSMLDIYYEVSEAFNNLYVNDEMFNDFVSFSGYYCTDVYNEYVIAKCCGMEAEYDFYKIGYTHNSDYSQCNFDAMDKWQGGNYQFVVGAKAYSESLDTKAGRMISASNMAKLQAALDAIEQIIEAATVETNSDTTDNTDTNTPVDDNTYNTDNTLSNLLADSEVKNSPVTIDDKLQQLRNQKLKYIEILKNRKY